MILHCNQAAPGESSPPTLSVVVACFNESRFIGATLASLFAQTRPADEIIVVDDASTDDSAAIVERLAQSRPALRLIRNPRNLGGVQASNAGLAAASGAYVFFMAANDIVLPAFFARTMAALQAHPQAGLGSSLSWLISEDGAPLDIMPTPLVRDQDGYIDAPLARRLMMREGNWIVGSTTVYRADALRATGGFDPALLSFCDAFVGPVVAARHGACFVPEALAAWRQHRGGFAAAVTGDPARVASVLDELVRRGPAVAPALFTPAYLRRLRRRARFESAAAILRRSGAGGPLPGYAALAGLPGKLASGLFRLARCHPVLRQLALAGLFVRLRPFDIVPVLRRRWHWRRRRAAIIGKGFPPIVPNG
jgi:hypothetical protein